MNQSRVRQSRLIWSPAVVVVVVVSGLLLTGAATAASTPSRVFAWGSNSLGALGDGSFTGPDECTNLRPCSTIPEVVGHLGGALAVTAGGSSGYALMADGSLVAWGDNGSGQLGVGSTTDQPSPVAVKVATNVRAIAASSGDAIALLQNGEVLAWGDNTSGQLGDGETSGPDECSANPCSSTPVRVEHLAGVTAIAAGGGFNLALLANGTVMSWGYNGYGQLGDGTTAESDVPVLVKHLRGVVAIAAGVGYALALLSDGAVESWGDDTFGELGTAKPGTCPLRISCSTTPTDVLGLNNVVAIAAGGSNAVALLRSGTVMTWGDNTYGGLGTGSSVGPDTCSQTTACAVMPQAIKGLTGVRTIAAGATFSLAGLANGTVVAWGDNTLGELGIGANIGPDRCSSVIPCSFVPTAVKELSKVRSFAAGGDFAVAIAP